MNTLFKSYLSLPCLILALSILAQPPARAAYYVAQDGQTPSGNYTSWASAASNIQAAVDVAELGGTVWVRAGTYTNSAANVVSIDQSLTLRSETGDPADVIVDGQNARRGIYVDLTTEGAAVTIDGLTITNGYKMADGGGGGIYIKHNTIMSGMGGVQHCVIAGNQVTNGYGGGLYSLGQAGTAFHTILSDCRIVGNTKNALAAWTGFGGGMAAWRTWLTMENCEVSENADHGGPDSNGGQSSGGGIYIREIPSGSVIRNCQFERNTADHGINPTRALGGGIFRQATDTDLLSIQNCVIQSNMCIYYAGGLYGGNLSVENCRIQYNLGGLGGGMYTVWDVEARNCLITHNESTIAVGGWYHLKNPSVLSVDNCTITSNKTTGTSNPVGGLQTGAGTAWVIRNSILYSNVAPSSVFLPNYYLSGSGIFSNCCARSKPGAAAPTGPGNTNTYPEFVSAASGDFHLVPETSPCINTGTNQLWMTTARDLDSNDRIDWESGLVDIGCYEYTPPPPAGTAVIIR